MLKVYVENHAIGKLFKSELKPDIGQYLFTYQNPCLAENAISLTMPVVADPYPYTYKHKLHPIFDMNLPEGELGKRLRSRFGKAVTNFDDLALLKITGKSQLGRLRFAGVGEDIVNVPAQSLKELIVHDGAAGLFESLLERYATYSGISGVQPKVLLRDSDASDLGRLTHRDATHIVKAWQPDEYPQLAANEYFCMRAAQLANINTPQFELSQNGKFLIITRFDLQNDGAGYYGFEDFCVLNGFASEQKYDASYESICKRIKAFVSPELIPAALQQFFKTLVLSCIVRNGDAHLKNFGVLYDNYEGSVSLAPCYDIVCTTAYHPADTLALLLGGSKRWPQLKTLVKFAGMHCNIPEARAKILINEVAEGVTQAASEMAEFMRHNDYFRDAGQVMLAEWNKGLIKEM